MALGCAGDGAGPARPTDDHPGPAACPPSGRTVLQRLNGTEYDNTVRDLLGIDARPSTHFPADDRANVFDNNAALQTLTATRVQGYLEAAEALSARVLAERPARVISCWPRTPAEAAPCARAILEPLVARAYRRPPAAGELEAVLALHDASAADGFEAGLGAAIEAILIAPQFLFRSLDGGAGALDDHALAARLSYFLWRTMPDAQLRALADAGRLRERPILEAEVRRMLADPRVSELVDVLTTQWLALRGLEGAAPSRDCYAVFYDDDLRPAMARETSRFVDPLVRTGVHARRARDRALHLRRRQARAALRARAGPRRWGASTSPAPSAGACSGTPASSP